MLAGGRGGRRVTGLVVGLALTLGFTGRAGAISAVGACAQSLTNAVLDGMGDAAYDLSIEDLYNIQDQAYAVCYVALNSIAVGGGGADSGGASVSTFGMGTSFAAMQPDDTGFATGGALGTLDFGGVLASGTTAVTANSSGVRWEGLANLSLTLVARDPARNSLYGTRLYLFPDSVKIGDMASAESTVVPLTLETAGFDPKAGGDWVGGNARLVGGLPLLHAYGIDASGAFTRVATVSTAAFETVYDPLTDVFTGLSWNAALPAETDPAFAGTLWSDLRTALGLDPTVALGSTASLASLRVQTSFHPFVEVPEPAALGLLGATVVLGGLAARRRRG